MRILATIIATLILFPTTSAIAAEGSNANQNQERINLNRPSRGHLSSPIREAATVPPRTRAWATCVLTRESGGVLHNKQSREDARNGSSSAAGRWQFLQAWQRGGSFMVRDRLVDFGVPRANAKRVRQYLGDRPIYQWDGFWQDVLFNEVIDRGGYKHWYNGGDKCDRIMPR